MTEKDITNSFTNESGPIASTWFDPANSEARHAFTNALRNYQFDQETLRSAWCWFLNSWKMDEEISPANIHRSSKSA